MSLQERSISSPNVKQREMSYVSQIALLVLVSLALAFATKGGYARDIPFQAGGRSVRINTPISYDNATAAGQNVMVPLVVLLHGIGGSGPAIARQYSIDEVSEGLNFAWIAPSARGRSWCAPGCRGRGRDGRNPDSVWLRSVVEAAMEIVNIDKQRIYFAGVSNGGYMTYRMACDHSDLIAGIMPICGANTNTGCVTDNPVHIVHIHGDRDGTVPYRSGVRAFDSFALRSNNCTGSRERMSDDGYSIDRIVAETYSGGCTAETQFWRAPGVGHCPGPRYSNFSWLLDKKKPLSEEESEPSMKDPETPESIVDDDEPMFIRDNVTSPISSLELEIEKASLRGEKILKALMDSASP